MLFWHPTYFDGSTDQLLNLCSVRGSSKHQPVLISENASNFSDSSQQTVIKRILCCLFRMQKCSDSIQMFLYRINGFGTFLTHIFLMTLTTIFDFLAEIIRKIIEGRYISIFLIISKIIDIGRRLPQIIGDLEESLAKLSILIMTGESSKKYC